MELAVGVDRAPAASVKRARWIHGPPSLPLSAALDPLGIPCDWLAGAKTDGLSLPRGVFLSF